MASAVIYPVIGQMVSAAYLDMLTNAFGANGLVVQNYTKTLGTSQGISPVAGIFNPSLPPIYNAAGQITGFGKYSYLWGDQWLSYSPEQKKTNEFSIPVDYFDTPGVSATLNLFDNKIDNYTSAGIQWFLYEIEGMPPSDPPDMFWNTYKSQIETATTSDPQKAIPQYLVTGNGNIVVGNSLTIDQQDASLALTNAVTQNVKEVPTNGSAVDPNTGQVLNSSLAQTLLSCPPDAPEPLTDAATLNASSTASTSTATTNGVSNTSSVSFGASSTAGIKNVASLGVNTSLAESLTVNTSTTESQTQSSTVSFSNTATVTLQPGQAVLIEATFVRQQSEIPFIAPIDIKGSVKAVVSSPPALSTFGSANISPETALDSASSTYGYFPASMLQNPSGESGSQAGTIYAQGEFTNVNAGTFNITEVNDSSAAPWNDDSSLSPTVVAYAAPASPTSSSFALQRPSSLQNINIASDQLLSDEQVQARKVSQGDLPTVVIDGVERKVGLFYHLNADWGDHLAGGDLDDVIHILKEGQTASTHGGHDRVYGTEGKDRVYLDSGLDQAHTFAGDDLIVARSGSHLIKSGAGNDRIELFLGRHNDDLGVHTIEAGDDSDSIHFHKEGREFSRIVALVEDFSSQDNLTLHGFDEVTGQVIAGSLYLKENGRSFAKFRDFSGGVPIFGTREELIEHALLNAGRYGSDILSQDSLQDVMNEMVTHELLDSTGSGPKTEYSSVKDSISDAFVALDSIAREFDIDPEAFVYRGVLARGDFSNMRDLVDHLLGSDPSLSDEFSSSSNLMDWW